MTGKIFVKFNESRLWQGVASLAGGALSGLLITLMALELCGEKKLEAQQSSEGAPLIFAMVFFGLFGFAFIGNGIIQIGYWIFHNKN